MKTLLISGSPRKGNTEYILDEIYESISDEKELILLRNKDIKFCTGCLFGKAFWQSSFGHTILEFLCRRLNNGDCFMILIVNKGKIAP